MKAVLAANPDAPKAEDKVSARRACARGRAGVGARGGGGGGVWAREGRWASALTPRVASALRTVCPKLALWHACTLSDALAAPLITKAGDGRAGGVGGQRAGGRWRARGVVAVVVGVLV